MSATSLILAAAVAVGEDSAAENRAPDFVVPIAHSVGLMTVMRTTEAVIWPDPFARTEYFGARYEEAFTKPPIYPDGDAWYVNYVGHAFFGSELYLRARTCHFGWAGSLAFAAAGSTLWEYAFEGNGVRPSLQDLVYTPLAGAALGELRYFAWRSLPTKSPARFIFDPLGELERTIGTDC